MAITSLQRRQLLIFGLGWFAYASTYFLRKPLGVIKADLETDLHMSRTQLGWLDTALMLPYALMQMILGSVGDKFGSRRTFGVCLLLAALSMFSFGMWSTFSLFCILLFVNGAAQSQCWPNCSKIIGSWYPDSVRNTVFGTFGTCAFAGGILGTSLAVYLQTSFGWRQAFLVPSVLVAVFGLLVLLFYYQPNEVGIEIPGKEQPAASKQEGTLSWIQLWRIPMVPEIAIGVFCLKVVRYAMYMWLPIFLLQHLNYSQTQAGMFSTLFEVGGVCGSALIGLIIDRYFQGRSLFGTTISVFLSTVSLVLFIVTSSWGMAFNSIFLLLAGAFNCGPDSLLGGSVPAELGEMDGRNAAAATIGLVNGFGSVGTFLEGPIIGIISTWYGWSGMFYLMVIMSLIGTFSVYRSSVIYARKTSLTLPGVE